MVTTLSVTGGAGKGGGGGGAGGVALLLTVCGHACVAGAPDVIVSGSLAHYPSCSRWTRPGPEVMSVISDPGSAESVCWSFFTFPLMSFQIKGAHFISSLPSLLPPTLPPHTRTVQTVKWHSMTKCMNSSEYFTVQYYSRWHAVEYIIKVPANIFLFVIFFILFCVTNKLQKSNSSVFFKFIFFLK